MDFTESISIPVVLNYTPRLGKKKPQYSRHNFDKFRHSFVIFGTNHPNSSVYWNIRKFSPTWQRRYMEMTPYLTSSKMPFTDKDGHFNKSFSKGKTWHCWKYMRTESGVVDEITFQKLIQSVLFSSRRRPTLSRRHCSFQWRRAVVVSQHALRAASHIVNIHFELN